MAEKCRKRIYFKELWYHPRLLKSASQPVAYLRGGTVRWPPFGPTMKFFSGDFIWKGAFFVVFQQELQNSTMFNSIFSYRYNMRLKSLVGLNLIWRCNFLRLRISEKMGEFAASIERSKAKSVSASGGLRPPDPPTRGSVPGSRWGLRP